MNIQSGGDKHQFRRLHGALALIKHINAPDRLELYSSLEPVGHRSDSRDTIGLTSHSVYKMRALKAAKSGISQFVDQTIIIS
jgi:hypothetical protein